MEKNKQFVITINRELGSGGRTIGEKLAARLGVPFYDKALVKAIEEKYNLTVEEIERIKGERHSWWADFQRNITPFSDAAKWTYYSAEAYEKPEKLTSENMFKTETRILEEMAQDGSCVIAGRSAFFIFRNHPNHLNILIQAPFEQRVQRVMTKQNLSKEVAENVLHAVDKKREYYVNRYTGSSRYDTRNYDLVVNMKNMTEDDAVELIMDFIEKSR
jgi:cytidylate kinase